MHFAKFLEHKITLVILSILAVFVIIVGSYYVFRQQKQILDVVSANTMNIQQSVRASGNIDSDENVSLSFQNSGTVQSIDVSVGDHVSSGQTLASLNNSNLFAQLEGAKADVLSAKASLQSLLNGATSQTLAVYNQGVSTASLALTTSLEDSYLKVSDAVLNKSDILFQNSNSANPTIVIPTDSYSAGLSLNNSRVAISNKINQWKLDLTSSSTASNSLISESSDVLSMIKNFLDSLTTETTRLNIGNSGLSQTQINIYIATVNAAETEANAAISEYNSAVQAYKTSNDQLAVITASSTPEKIQIAEASVSKAEANVTAIQSHINDGIIKAPFDGIVASVNPKVGEVFPVSMPAITLVSAGNYKINLMIPENEIAKIKIGDKTILDFSASNDLVATATVSSIDLSPTVIDGVNAYKTTIYLNSPNQNIRVGMTANATIFGETVTDVLTIPSSAIINENNSQLVLLKNSNNQFIKQIVETGISNDSYTEIKSGLKVGDMVATFGK